MEYFDLTFFISGNEKICKTVTTILLERLGLNLGDNPPAERGRNTILSEKEIYVDSFMENDYCTVSIGIPELVITNKNYSEIMRLLAKLSYDGLSVSKRILFATGMYEATYYYLDDARTLSALTPNRMEKFPLLFFREGEEPEGAHIISFPHISLRHNANAQIIFANPISSLMEDEGLTMEEAMKRMNE